MNVQCVECRRELAKHGCPECAHEIADKHRAAHPDHTVHVLGVDETKHGALVGNEYPSHPFPQWQRSRSV